MRSLLVELRRGPGLWMAPLLLAVGVFIGADQLPTAAVWTYANGAVAASIRLAGPVAGGVAAWAGLRCHRRRTRSLEATAARAPVMRAVTECAALLVWTVGTLTVATGVLFLYTGTSATWGGPSWWWLVETMLAYAVHVTVGYTAGRLVPYLLTPPLVLIGLFLLDAQAALRPGDHLTPLLPADPYVWLPFDVLNNRLLAGQCLWFLALIGVCVAALVARTRSGARLLASAGTASVLLAVVAVPVAIGGSTQFTFIGRHVLFRCAGSEPQLCLHPAFTDARPALTAQFAALQRKLAGTPFALHRVEQRPRGIGSTPTPGAVAFGLDGFRSRDYTEAIAEVVGNEMGDQACGQRQDAATSTAPDLNILVESWAADQNGKAATPSISAGAIAFFPAAERKAASRLAAWPAPARKHFLIAAAPQIRTCRLTVADFR